MKRSDKILSLIIIAILSLLAYYLLTPFVWTANGPASVLVCDGNPLTAGTTAGCGGFGIYNTQAAGVSSQYLLGLGISSMGPFSDGSHNVFVCPLGTPFVNASNGCVLGSGIGPGETLYIYPRGKVIGVYDFIVGLIFVASILFIVRILLEGKKK